MFDRWHSNQEGNNQGDQAYQNARIVFCQQVQSVISAVEDIMKNLSPAYPEEALLNFSRRFEKLSMSFTCYTIQTSSTFYEVVRRSNLRRATTKQVAQQSKSIAQLFERYARNPKTYSAVNSRLEINKLLITLENLLTLL